MSGLTEHALTEMIITGALCGVLGVQVVLRRLAFFTESLSHITFLGIVTATVTELDVKIGAAVAAMGAVAMMGRGSIAPGGSTSIPASWSAAPSHSASS